MTPKVSFELRVQNNILTIYVLDRDFQATMRSPLVPSSSPSDPLPINTAAR
jgi:hypothetical protein